MPSVEIVPAIRRDDDHELRIVDTGERGVVLQVWRRENGSWRPSRRFLLAIRHSEIPRVLEALSLAFGHRAPSR